VDSRELREIIKIKQSYLCVGLDTDIARLPDGFSRDYRGIINFNKEIVDATKDYAVAYKMNTAFYEQLGSNGWKALEKTRDLLPTNVLSIADAKRGDIGNTSRMYAKAFFETLSFDAVTVAPYMGIDSVEPFLEFSNKYTIVLGLTSNKGSQNFQTNPIYEPHLYKTVLKTIKSWGSVDNLMFVVGATKADSLKEIRKIIPNHFLLIPGVGAQGGNATEVCVNGKNSNGGLLINSSRGIIYASSDKNFAKDARQKAKEMALETKPYTQHL